MNKNIVLLAIVCVVIVVAVFILNQKQILVFPSANVGRWKNFGILLLFSIPAVILLVRWLGR